MRYVILCIKRLLIDCHSLNARQARRQIKSALAAVAAREE